jgi:hypothetical protein
MDRDASRLPVDLPHHVVDKRQKNLPHPVVDDENKIAARRHNLFYISETFTGLGENLQTDELKVIVPPLREGGEIVLLNLEEAAAQGFRRRAVRDPFHLKEDSALVSAAGEDLGGADLTRRGDEQKFDTGGKPLGKIGERLDLEFPPDPVDADNAPHRHQVAAVS